MAWSQSEQGARENPGRDVTRQHHDLVAVRQALLASWHLPGHLHCAGQ